MDTVRSKDGTAIAFDRVGEGPPLVLVAGAFQHRAIDPAGEQLAGLLAPRFTVVRYDRRGRGDSGDTLPYAPDREIEDVWAVIDEAGGSAFFELPFIVEDSHPPLPEDYVARLTERVSAGRRGDAVVY